MESNMVRVLAVEDNPADLRLLKEQLRESASTDFEIVGAGTLQGAIRLLQAGSFAVILLDLNLPDSFGLDGIGKILAAIPSAPPVVVLTELDNQETGVQALSRNAQDYLVKGKINSDTLVRCIRYAIQRDKTEKAVRQMNAELGQRVAELRTANENLRLSRLAALNLTEDAISARQQAEQLGSELARASEQLRVTLTSIGDGVISVDIDGRITFLNPVAAGLTGWTPDNAISQTWSNVFQIINEKTRQPAEDIVERSLKERRVVNLANNTVLIAKDGREIPIEDSAAPILDATHNVLGVVLVFHDVTEKRRAQESLRKAHDELEQRVQERTEELAVKNRELSKEINEREEVERRLRIQTTAMEAAANGILITDPDGNIQWANPALSRISAYEVHELLGQSTRIFSSGQQDANFYCQMWNTILSGQVWRGEMTNRRKDGSLYVEEQTITPVRDEDGLIPHFIAIKQDITERKRAERELAQRNVELQALSLAEHEQRQFAEALAKAAIILNKSLELDDVLAHILEQIKEVIPYQLANVTLLEGKTLYGASHRGEASWPEALADIKSRFALADFPLMKKMIRTRQPVLIPDTFKEPGWIRAKNQAWSGSFLSAPLLVEKRVIGFVNIFVQQHAFFTQTMCDRLVAFAAHAAAAIQNAGLFEQVRTSSERLHSLSQKLVEVQENERRYISRELHDEAGQLLASLMVDLHLLEKKVSQPEEVKKTIVEMHSSLNQVLENLHRVAMALRPASLDHLGLIAALNQSVESVGEKHALKASFSSRKIQKRLPPNVEIVLYRIVQEALTNVVRHARATQVDVILTVRDDKLVVIVEDNGIGFDSDEALKGDHLGLFGMRERIEMIGGKLTIESAPGKGTTLIAEVNYADKIADRR